MKKITVVFLVFILILSGCTRNKEENPSEPVTENITRSTERAEEEKGERRIFTWLSCFELQVTKERDDRESYVKYIESLLDNMAELQVTDVFVHARAYADALYFSQIFPQSDFACAQEGKRAELDILQTVIDCAREKEIRVHAWINPYRASSQSSAEKLSEDSIALRWLRQGSSDICVTKNGIWFKPSSLSVQRLVLEGVREILDNYSVDGIHIDDYFYPDTMDSDLKDYEDYLSSGGTLSLTEWRSESVSCLLSSLYSLVKSYGEDKLFSVSPSGDIEKNQSVSCADVSRWCSEKGFCDIILPQIYYGFDHERLPFEECADRWYELCTCPEVKLVPALALYKAGTEDGFAFSGKYEWTLSSDIIARQVSLLEKKGMSDFALYSGSYINFSETFLSEELKNLKNVIQ